MYFRHAKIKGIPTIHTMKTSQRLITSENRFAISIIKASKKSVVEYCKSMLNPINPNKNRMKKKEKTIRFIIL